MAILKAASLGINAALQYPRVAAFAKGTAKPTSLFFGISQRAAKPFIAGEHPHDAARLADELATKNIHLTSDCLGEDAYTPQRVDEVKTFTKSMIDAIYKRPPSNTTANISMKLTNYGQAFHDQFADKIATENALEIVAHAQKLPDKLVRFDMEGPPLIKRTLRIASDIHSTYPSVGIVLQAAMFDSPEHILLHSNKSIRWVKGAYSAPADVAHTDPKAIEKAYLEGAALLLDTNPRPAFATHDPHLIEEIIKMADAKGIPKSGYEFQMLHGINPTLPLKLAKEGYKVRIYAPIGDDAIAYMIRRLIERPENIQLVLNHGLNTLKSVLSKLPTT